MTDLPAQPERQLPPTGPGWEHDPVLGALHALTDQLGALIAELHVIADVWRQTLAQPAQSNVETRDRTAAGLRTQLRHQRDYEGLGYVETTAGRHGQFGFGLYREAP